MSDVSIELENVRCFRERTVIPLAPMTLLVGENSTGKSTFLAMIRLATDIGNRATPTDFNEEPFPLGTYETIASVRGRTRASPQFTIGVSRQVAYEGTERNVTCRGIFAERDSQPQEVAWLMETDSYRFQIRFGESGSPTDVTIDTPHGEYSSRLERDRRAAWFWREFSHPSLLFLARNANARHGRPISGEDAQVLSNLAAFHATRLRPFAIAPIRTQPQRTYDRLTDRPRPAGGHVPMVLAKVLAGSNSQRLKSAINSFGRASGLYEKIKVRLLGDDDSGPFQIQIDFGGSTFNLVDIGYGVSQILPVLVEALRLERGGRLLIQQPEVHLHPRAQAELGSLLLHLANEEDKSFVVETHSDYLIGRVMSEVREARIDPAKVRILYFERQDPYRVQIHPMRLDEEGNLLDAPPSYRSFFLEEERRLLGV